MDSNRIKNLATGAREALRNEASARLDAVLAEGSAARLESPFQVAAIEADIDAHGRDEVVDRAAYTWFNRLCALRFMDANGYTPTPVVTPRPGQTQPAVLADAAQGVFDPEWEVPQDVRRRVVSLLSGATASANAAEDAYSLLLRAVCARYAGPMGYLFAEDVASSLLMPQGLLAQGSILSRIVGDMDGAACASVEVMGWLYQFYIAERKGEYFSSKRKAAAEDIPAATQLFTPDWIVKYLAENSLGRLWMLNNPGSELAGSMDYYVAPEGDEPHIEVASADEIRVLDPACGSGHILVYAFDLLFMMYEEEGWPTEDIPKLILENNLFGLEIDRRAAEIASFALEMKARARDPRWFEKRIDARVRVLEPVGLLPQELELVPQLAERAALLEAMEHLDEVGSLYVPDPLDEFTLQNELEHVGHDISLFAEKLLPKLRVMLANVRALSGGYHCVIANPPYMGGGNMNPWFSNWVKTNYPNEKGDTCICFIRRALSSAFQKGYSSLITMQTWMFQSSYEEARRGILNDSSITTLAHLGAHAFDSIGGEVVSTAAFTLQSAVQNRLGTYYRLTDLPDGATKQQKLLQGIMGVSVPYSYLISSDKFSSIPGSVVCYWAGEHTFRAFAQLDALGKHAQARSGLQTNDVARFLRLWFEVDRKKTDLDCTGMQSSVKWRKYVKGGPYRRWYGNREYLVNWENDGSEIISLATKLYNSPTRTVKSRDKYFLSGLTWSDVSTGLFSVRYLEEGFIFDTSAPTVFYQQSKYLMLGFLNSSTCQCFLDILSPTLHYNCGAVAKIPLQEEMNKEEATICECVVSDQVELSRNDWDSFETSWDFVRHPMAYFNAEGPTRIADAYVRWEAECRGRFDRLKSNEEELNRIFARIYHMEGEVPIEVSDDKVSVRLAERARDARSLVSYAIGCLFGRYSTGADGLVLADQGATVDDFRAKVPDATFFPDTDNVLPVLADEWFDDDIVAGVRRWLAHTYGEEALEENVAWLEESIGKDLRSYLVKDFYSDHLKTYQKRPIYWMFQSPKGAFRCLVYMHRYDEGTVGTILTGYLRPLEDKLRARLRVLESPSASAADAREANRVRGMVAELEQWEREVVYPLAHERVPIDLDDGVKVNYNKFPKALAKVSGLSEWR